MCPQDKTVLRIKIRKWDGFQENSIHLFSNRQKFYFHRGFALGTQLQTNLNNKYINCFYSVGPFEQ